MVPRIGVTLGDVTGIGPEVALKALAQEAGEPDVRYLLIGDEAHLRRHNRGPGLPLAPWKEAGDAARFAWVDPRPEPLPPDLAPGSPAAAAAATDWLWHGACMCLRQQLAALVTAPLNKEAVIRSGRPFVGQTEFLADAAGVRQAGMMLLGHDERGRWLRVLLATTHLPLREVPDALTTDGLVRSFALAHEACQSLDLPRARIAVCGLNPHAGEGGNLGREETEVIRPAVLAARDRGWDVDGPFAADSLFHQAVQGACEVVVAMYHDQGLGPLKLLAFETGVNWTLGLPFARTSPDHGTAYDLAGRDQANPSSMRAALRLARRLVLRGGAGKPLAPTPGAGQEG